METLIDRGVTQRPVRTRMGDGFGALLWIMFFLLVAGSVLVVVGSGTFAKEPDLVSSADFLSGQVTAKRGNQIQINHQDYLLDPRVTITDDEGSPKHVEDLEPGAWVKFHLKDTRIDRIVLMLPR